MPGINHETTEPVYGNLLVLMYLDGHLGRDKTTQKIADRFYWKNLWYDAREFVQQCNICQRTNDAKFQKQAAPFHPIPVKSKVLNQVCRVTRLTRVYCISTNRLYYSITS